MKWREDRFALAVGIDAAEPASVRELMARGEMPALKSLADEGAWLRVESPARVGSGSVWPTFITGAGPAAHGAYGEWCWRPASMDLERYHGRGLKPFWEAPARGGLTVGVFDVPFMPLVGLSKGFEISEWGAHDVLEGRLDFSPAGLAPLLSDGAPRHPLALDRLDASGPDDEESLARIAALCLEGVKMRVFSLHGMRPTRGIPSFLGPLLCENGFARLADWRAKTWRERAVSGLAALKRSMPAPLKRLYYRTLPQTATQRLARPTMMPAYDWPRTRAFALPTDQHGWVRVNLEGREARGVVRPEHYDATCREVEALLRSLLTEDGRPLVREVMRTAARVEDATHSKLPDIVVHWHDAAHETPLKIRGLSAGAKAAGLKFTGQHAPEGFCVTNARGAGGANTVRAEDMHRSILGHLAGAAAAAPSSRS